MPHAGITDSLKQLKSAKACGRLVPKLLKHASKTLIPSLQEKIIVISLF